MLAEGLLNPRKNLSVVSMYSNCSKVEENFDPVKAGWEQIIVAVLSSHLNCIAPVSDVGVFAGVSSGGGSLSGGRGGSVRVVDRVATRRSPSFMRRFCGEGEFATDILCRGWSGGKRRRSAFCGDGGA